MAVGEIELGDLLARVTPALLVVRLDRKDVERSAAARPLIFAGARTKICVVPAWNSDCTS